MKPEDKDTSKGSSFWGIFCSIALHVVVLILVLFWGFRSTMQDSSPGPIEVSLSELGTGGGGGVRSRPAPPPPPPAPAEPEPEPEPPAPAPPKEEVAKVPPPEPEKKPEPKKEEPKEVAKVEPDKKVIPIEPEKKPEKTPEPKPEKKEVKKETPAPKKEPEKKEVKKEVAKKPEPTEKPKAPQKKTTAKSEKNLESEKSKVLQDLKRQKVLDNLKREPSEEPTEMEEPMGEEQRLAMADTEGIPDKPAGEPGELSRSGSGGGGREGGGGGGSAVNPVLLDIYKKKVHQRIRRNWRIPPGVPTDGNLATLVFFKVDGAGRVFDVRVSKSSGNSAFDQFSLDAIQKSAPLPVPPSEFAAQAESEGMEITFYNRPY